MNLKGIKSFSGVSTGYLYSIDFNRYKDKCHMFNKNPNSNIEFVIEGDVDFIKREQFKVNWTVESSDICIKQHGLANLIDSRIDFPDEEIPELIKQSKIFTTRVDSDYSKYHEGDIVITPWNKRFVVIKRLNINSIDEHPYLKYLTDNQKKLISKYDHIACLWLQRK